MNRPIFILGCTKSGTTLMRNLFDSYPGLFVLPLESHFFQSIRRWVDYYFRRTMPRKLNFEEMKEGLFQHIKFVNSRTNLKADAFTENMWDLEKVKKTLDSTPVKNLRELSDLYVQVIHQNFYGGMPDPTSEFVEKSVENAEFAFEWSTIYPEARFIRILRNPYSNIVSIRRHIQRKSKRYPFMKPAVYSMYNSYWHMYKNRNLLKNHKIVIYDELIQRPEKVMREVADFLGVPFKESLIQPSFLGEPWGGNSQTGKKFTKISPTVLNRWKKEITHLEIHLVNDWFDFVLKDYGFKKIDAHKRACYPVKNEGLRTYFLNRMLIKYMPDLA